MNRNNVLIIGALSGLVIVVIAIFMGNRTAAPPTPSVLPPKVPYTSYITGAGLVESSTGNIAISTPVGGIVSDIFVKIGEKVEKDAPLFKIDDRDLQARLLLGTAKLAEAQAVLEKSRANLDIAEELNKKSSISKKDLYDKRADVAINQAGVEVAEAEVKKTATDIDLHTIRAPVAGEILQIKILSGEYADTRISSAGPLMILGGNSLRYVRVDIDEYDAWRFDSAQPATAFVPGNPSLKIPLTFVRVEPYVIPKRSLTGNVTERTDTRVLQVIYSFDLHEIPLYIGQQLDIYIKASSTGQS